MAYYRNNKKKAVNTYHETKPGISAFVARILPEHVLVEFRESSLEYTVLNLPIKRRLTTLSKTKQNALEGS